MPGRVLISRNHGVPCASRMKSARATPSSPSISYARFAAACARALAHDSPFYRTVKSILSTGADKTPAAEPFTPPAYANPRFARDAATLFASPKAQLDLLH